MTKPLLIGLTGLAGSGKDTVREILVNGDLPFSGIAFADPIRDMLKALLDSVGVNPRWMTDRDLKERDIPEIGSSYRKMAQQLGTEWGRAIDPDFWLKIARTKVQVRQRNGFHTVVSDVRFPNEAAWIKANGGVVWKISRPGIEPVRAHASEALVDGLPYDYVINNRGSIEDLKPAVQAALAYLGMQEHVTRETDARLIAESNAVALGVAQ